MVEPVIITYHERPRFVLLTMAEFDRLRGRHRKIGGVTELPPAVADQIEALADLRESGSADTDAGPVTHGANS